MGSDEAALDEARRDQPEPATPPEDRDDWTTDSSSQAASSRPAPPEPDWEDRWRRAVADLDNARKRCARELDRVRADERARVASRWLSVLDNLELALSHARADPATIVSGVQAVRDEAVAVLNALGYPRRDESIYVGLPFDPAKHEVVTVVDDPDAAPAPSLTCSARATATGKRSCGRLLSRWPVSRGEPSWRATTTKSLGCHAAPVRKNCSELFARSPAVITRM